MGKKTKASCSDGLAVQDVKGRENGAPGMGVESRS